MTAHGPGAAARGRGQAGFTLVELVIVLAIIVVASGYAILNLESLTAAGRLRAAGRELANHLKFARSCAVISGRPVYVYYYLDKDSYYLSRRYYGAERGVPRWYEMLETEDAFEFPRGVRLARIVSPLKTSDRDIERFDFTPFGACVSHCVYLKGPEEKDWLTVEVNGLTGQVTLHRYYKEFNGVAKHLPGIKN